MYVSATGRACHNVLDRHCHANATTNTYNDEDGRRDQPVQTAGKDIVGVDDTMVATIKGKLRPLLHTLGYDIHVVEDPDAWLRSHPVGTILLPIPDRSPNQIGAAHKAASRATIIGVGVTMPTSAACRRYLHAGSAGIVGIDLPPNELAVALEASLRGLVAMPLRVARAIVGRLEEPPHNLYLTNRDTQMLELIARGQSPKDMSTNTQYSERHLRRITSDLFSRIGATNRAHAAAIATRWGFGWVDERP